MHQYQVVVMFDPARSVSLTFEAESPEDAAEAAFRLLGEMETEPNWKGLSPERRIMVVGDIAKVSLGTESIHLLCLGMGWMTVEADFIEAWLALPELRRMPHRISHLADPLASMIARRDFRRSLGRPGARVSGLNGTPGESAHTA